MLGDLARWDGRGGSRGKPIPFSPDIQRGSGEQKWILVFSGRRKNEKKTRFP